MLFFWTAALPGFLLPTTWGLIVIEISGSTVTPGATSCSPEPESPLIVTWSHCTCGAEVIVISQVRETASILPSTHLVAKPS